MGFEIDNSRIYKLNHEPVNQGPVFYWMSRDQRVRDNWALLYAQKLALERKQPLAVIICLVPEFLGATLRQYRFMLKGLAELEKDLFELGITFILLKGEPAFEVTNFCRKKQAGALVTDFSPLRINSGWKTAVAEKLPLAFYEVDAHNIVPCRLASDKQEYAAYTFRPKIKRQLQKYLTDIPEPVSHPYSYLDLHNQDKNKKEELSLTDWQAAEKLLTVDRSVPEVLRFKPGEAAARKAMQHFLSSKIAFYDRDRNDPSKNGQSKLSCYLHFGQLSPQRLAYEVNKAGAKKNDHLVMESKEAFLEELVVRRELSDNYCFYNQTYDSTAGFPRWARESLDLHRKDSREYLYTLPVFEEASTHDRLWNAAQNEMAITGKMHGYMRMYWAKKILEWTESPGQAQKFAIYLNDKYSLDGRDPNGYSGIAWSIGGVHDRAWGERSIFGKVRYMSYKGSRSKFNIDHYLEKVQKSIEEKSG